MTTTNVNGTKKRKPKPQSLIEQNTMRNVQALLLRSGITPEGGLRVLRYLQMAIEADQEAAVFGGAPMEPAPVDPPNQLKVPGTQDEELPFE
jgi:hypothetical protein